MIEHTLYHIEMMLHELAKRFKPNGDTRMYLSLDDVEIGIVTRLLRREQARRKHFSNSTEMRSAAAHKGHAARRARLMAHG